MKSQGSMYLNLLPKDGLFHKVSVLSLNEFYTGHCKHLGNCKFTHGTADT